MSIIKQIVEQQEEADQIAAQNVVAQMKEAEAFDASSFCMRESSFEEQLHLVDIVFGFAALTESDDALFKKFPELLE